MACTGKAKRCEPQNDYVMMPLCNTSIQSFMQRVETGSQRMEVVQNNDDEAMGKWLVGYVKIVSERPGTTTKSTAPMHQWRTQCMLCC